MSANGRLPLSSLTVISTGHRLRGDAAGAFERLRAGFRTATGRVLSVTDAYRDLAAQVKVRAAKGKFAAVPGTSNHGWGIALDLGSGVNVDTSAEHRWMDAHASEYGWVNPTWARDNNPNNGEDEPWHWEYVPQLDQHDGIGDAVTVRPATPTSTHEEEDMFTDADRQLMTRIAVLAETAMQAADIATNAANRAAEYADNAGKKVDATRADVTTVANEVRHVARAIGHPIAGS